MIKLENVVLASPEQMAFIIQGMRNPMNSWEKSDTCFSDESCVNCYDNQRDLCNKDSFFRKNEKLGSNDHSLMQRLSNAGTEHRKYMRMMPVYVRITAPLYWWKEFDTYKVGTVANSCSTMHKIAEKEFTLEDFSCEHLFSKGAATRRDDNKRFEDESCAELGFDHLGALLGVIKSLNFAREDYLNHKNKGDWWQLIQLLPSSYNQTRNVMLNYEVLANIYRQRKNHKLDEWREFCKWIEGLPYSELIIGKKELFSALSPMLEPGYADVWTKCFSPYVGPIPDQIFGRISKDDLVDMTEMPDGTDRDTLPKKCIFGDPM